MKPLRTAMVAFLGSTITLPTQAASFLQCSAADKPDIVVELDAQDFEGSTLSCLSGGDFIADMTPCAPEGGFGLSYPTGSASLSAVVHRWQEYSDHHGGVVGFTATPSSYGFLGGWMSSEGGFEKQWSFEVNRLDGSAKLEVVQEIEEDGAVGTSIDNYQCEAIKRKF